MKQDGSVHLPFFVLDVLRHDEAENLHGIIKLLNDDGCMGWRHIYGSAFTKDQVIPCIIKHIAEGNIELCYEDPVHGSITPIENKRTEAPIINETQWFHLTKAGRARWGEWQPPEESDT